MLDFHAKRLIAGGAAALALEVDRDPPLGIAQETAQWLICRQVRIRFRSRDIVRPLKRYVAPFGLAPLAFAFDDEPGISCNVKAPWTVLSLLLLAFLDEIQSFHVVDDMSPNMSF